MPEKPLISIVTPSFQQGATIEATIRSVLEQGYPRFEHLVMDGGSTDETVEVLRRYPHLQWVSEPDRGQTHAINKGLERSRGEIWAYLNSDDVYRSGCFEQVAEAFRDPACQVLVGDCDRIDGTGAVIGHDRAQLERPEWLGLLLALGAGRADSAAGGVCAQEFAGRGGAAGRELRHGDGPGAVAAAWPGGRRSRCSTRRWRAFG